MSISPPDDDRFTRACGSMFESTPKALGHSAGGAASGGILRRKRKLSQQNQKSCQLDSVNGREQGGEISAALNQDACPLDVCKRLSRHQSEPCTPDKSLRTLYRPLSGGGGVGAHFDDSSLLSPIAETRQILYRNLKLRRSSVTPKKQQVLFSSPPIYGKQRSSADLFNDIVSNTVIMSKVFLHLSNGDLFRLSMVCQTLKAALLRDAQARERFRIFRDIYKLNKENYVITPPGSPEQQASENDIHHQQSLIGIAKSRNFDDFCQIGGLIGPNQSLSKCQRCDRVSIVENDLSQCQNWNCGFISCLLCGSCSIDGPEHFVDKCNNSIFALSHSKMDDDALALQNGHHKQSRRPIDLLYPPTDSSSCLQDVSNSLDFFPSVSLSPPHASSSLIGGIVSSQRNSSMMPLSQMYSSDSGFSSAHYESDSSLLTHKPTNIRRSYPMNAVPNTIRTNFNGTNGMAIVNGVAAVKRSLFGNDISNSLSSDLTDHNASSDAEAALRRRRSSGGSTASTLSGRNSLSFVPVLKGIKADMERSQSCSPPISPVSSPYKTRGQKQSHHHRVMTRCNVAGSKQSKKNLKRLTR